MSYGGYGDYQTWNIYQRLAGEEGSFWTGQAAILWDDAEADDAFTRSEVARFALAHALEEDRHIVGDIYGPAFSNVNWGKIAGALLAGCKGYKPPTRKTGRRRHQHLLSPLLVLAVVVAVSCGWFARETKEARQQRKAVEAIEALGGYVVYDYELPPRSEVFSGSCTRQSAEFPRSGDRGYPKTKA